ncbi:MAG TPA: hypothetical protein PKV27_08980 [Ilumatobacteraceae bacterium]|nr:hypothetical protein [Ilumatobacteraceae bacterium]
MPTDDEMLRRLDELQAESAARRAELMAIAAQVPATLSRRSLIRAAAADLRHAPDKADIVRRALAKLGRAPSGLVRRARRRFG